MEPACLARQNLSFEIPFHFAQILVIHKFCEFLSETINSKREIVNKSAHFCCFAKKDKISIVKIDVEGSECDVLLSMEDQIILNKPIILFEFNDYKTKNSIISLLNKFEYTDFYVFKKELVRNPLKKLFPKDLSRLKKIKLDSKKDFSMVITYRRDSEYKLNNIN